MHVPVMTKEVLEHLNLKSGENIIDATLDGGGHAKLFLNTVGPSGKVLGIEQDSKMIESLKSEIRSSRFAEASARRAKSEIWNNLIIAHGNFRNIAEIAKKNNFRPNAIFFDLGMSTWHLAESNRGFSFQKPNEVLDMRLSQDAEITAAEILNSYSREKLAQIFKEYGEEKKSDFLAKKIIEFRKRKRILVVENLTNALGTKHPKVLARIFQSLRIYINDELNALRNGLLGAFEILKNGGRMAVISYHSLEDREVKNFFSAKGGPASDGKRTKKPIVPGMEEIQKNSSARSAKLRILWKM